EVPAPGDGRGDPKILSRSEHAAMVDELTGAVDPEEPRRPRRSRDEIVPEQHHLVVARGDVPELPGPFGLVSAADVEVGAVVRDPHRCRVRLTVGADRADPADRLTAYVVDLRLRE